MISSFARRYGFELLVAIGAIEGALEVAFRRDPLYEPRIGMRERAALHGGRLTAGPASGGGFAVRVTLPIPDGAL